MWDSPLSCDQDALCSVFSRRWNTCGSGAGCCGECRGAFPESVQVQPETFHSFSLSLLLLLMHNDTQNRHSLEASQTFELQQWVSFSSLEHFSDYQWKQRDIMMPVWFVSLFTVKKRVLIVFMTYKGLQHHPNLCLGRDYSICSNTNPQLQQVCA